MLPEATTTKTLKIFFEEVGQEAVIYDVMAVHSSPSSVNQLLIKKERPLLESSPKSLPPIRFICVLNVNKDKLVEN